MTAPAETSAPPPRWPWLDRWFEPPWRALLTWVGLAVLARWAVEHFGTQWMETMADFFFDQLDRIMPMPLPRVVRWHALSINLALLMSWYEPLALRLNMPRSAGWLALRCVPYVAESLDLPLDSFLRWQLSFIASCALSVVVLRGWRSRPWMAVLAGAWVVGVSYYIDRFALDAGRLFRVIVPTLPFAALLLYGTRRLPR